VVAAGAAVPLVRRRLGGPAVLAQAAAYSAPVGLSVAARRTPARDVAVCVLQMWAYVMAYKHPHDDPQSQRASTHFSYPIVADRLLGAGELPTVRLQRALARVGSEGAEWRALDKVLVWAHWSWFAVPHGALAYLLARHPQRFPRAAALMYGVFDVGACFYWFLPTAPPWYAASEEMPGGDGVPAVRRMMVEYGEHFWRDGWGPLYSVFGGNPLAAMPSLHFATSLMAALLLAEVGPLPGALGYGYLIALGFALVYLGEHYVVDLVGGAALMAAVWRAGARAGPLAGRVRRAVARLEAMAHE
jgi:membrane-associated phospholipid phosphatase